MVTLHFATVCIQPMDMVKVRIQVAAAAVELHNMHFFKYRGLKGYAVERHFSHFFEK